MKKFWSFTRIWQDGKVFVHEIMIVYKGEYLMASSRDPSVFEVYRTFAKPSKNFTKKEINYKLRRYLIGWYEQIQLQPKGFEELKDHIRQ